MNILCLSVKTGNCPTETNKQKTRSCFTSLQQFAISPESPAVCQQLKQRLTHLPYTRTTSNSPPSDAGFTHLCRGSEETELQLWTDSSVEDFRGPTGDGSRLLLDGDSKWLLPGEGNEPLRLPSSTSALSGSVEPESDGRTRMGGTPGSPAEVPGSGHCPATSRDSDSGRAGWPWTGRPSSEMLLRNKRAACLRREFSLFLRVASRLVCGFLPDNPQAAAAAAAAMICVPPRKSAEGRRRAAVRPFYPARDRATPYAALIGQGRRDVSAQSPAPVATL